MPPELIMDPKDIPQTVIADIEAIRKFNPQRFEMEQLTAITHLDPEKWTIVGYKDITEKEFWVRGHMPNMPLMPGVVMCEAAAQLCSYFASAVKLIGPTEFVGFSGMEDVRFRGTILPGSRFWIVGESEVKKMTRRLRFRMQGFVDGKFVFNAIILGFAMSQSAVGKNDGDS